MVALPVVMPTSSRRRGHLASLLHLLHLLLLLLLTSTQNLIIVTRGVGFGFKL